MTDKTEPVKCAACPDTSPLERCERDCFAVIAAQQPAFVGDALRWCGAKENHGQWIFLPAQLKKFVGFIAPPQQPATPKE